MPFTRISIISLGCLTFTLIVSAWAVAPAFGQAASPATSPAPVQGDAGQPQDAPTTPQERVENSNLHAQSTLIVQGDGSFPAKYTGPNSLGPHSQIQHTLTADLFAGRRLGSGLEGHMDFLMWQGFGLQDTLGIEAFPNGDAYKYGTANPNFTFARLFIRKTVGLGGPKVDIADDQLDLAGKEDQRRLTFTAGRFAVTDIFDANAYASDPHRQFMNWAMIANLAWDYAADSIGFTTGAAAQYIDPKWTVSYGFFQLPKVPNSFTEDDQLLMFPSRGADGPFFKSWEMNLEADRQLAIDSHPGTIRLLAWVNEANMARYPAATAILDSQGPGADIASLRSFRYKYGFGLNCEQEVAADLGVFSRLGWNDGLEEPWAYTDANWSASAGTSVKGAVWRRPDDTFALAAVTSGISSENQQFLEAGGTGILDGDGTLRYGWETAMETYYSASIAKSTWASLDYQFVDNPAYNRDRGPVSIYGVRLHWEV